MDDQILQEIFERVGLAFPMIGAATGHKGANVREVPADAFTKADKRELTEIVFDAKKAIVLSAHPTEAYTISPRDGQLVLQITNPELFWSVTKYLVVITK